MREPEVRMIILSTDNLDESIRFYSDTLGLPLKFRDGAHFAALDGVAITLALATAVDHPIYGQVVVGIKTADVDAAAKAVEASGGGIVTGPYNDAHERRPWSMTRTATAWSSTARWRGEKPATAVHTGKCVTDDATHVNP
jgi:lactoylglutathione lyase